MEINILFSFIFLAIFFSAFITSCKINDQKINESEIADKIIAIEKTALDRWGKADPWGYLDIFADDITYFNPFEVHRIDGLEAMKKYYDDPPGQNFIDEYKMTDSKVQFNGNIAILSYHLFNYKQQKDGSLKETTRWNSTKVYALTNGTWKIIHNHWSFLQPDLKE
jgi:ketosteroid isomerase-like protein